MKVVLVLLEELRFLKKAFYHLNALLIDYVLSAYIKKLL